MAYLTTHVYRFESALASAATLLAAAFGLSALLTPLYVIYEETFGFSQITLALIYAAYVIGNIAALLLAGRICVLTQNAPWPLHLSFIVYFVVLSAVAVLIWFTQETVRPQAPPQLSIPSGIRAQFVAPAVTGFGLIALVAFYSALMPIIISHDLHIGSHAAASAMFFEFAIVAAVVIVATQSLGSRIAMLVFWR